MKELIEQSIAHWERMRDDPIGCGEEPFGDHCALCKEYYKTDGPNDDPSILYGCYQCPVRIKTGKTECRGSPWLEAMKSWKVLMAEFKDEDSMAKWKLAAQEEIDFLKSLL